MTVHVFWNKLYTISKAKCTRKISVAIKILNNSTSLHAKFKIFSSVMIALIDLEWIKSHILLKKEGVWNIWNSIELIWDPITKSKAGEN